MKRRIVFTLVVFAFASVFCQTMPVLSPVAKTGEPVSRYESNTWTVDGNTGIASLPVECDSAGGDVSMPKDSFAGQETFTISCISANRAQELDELVKQETGETNSVLGAISLEPSPFDFSKDVTITIPLLYPRPDLAGQEHDLYCYAPNVSTAIRYVEKARIDDQGVTASAQVDHFSIFILIGPPVVTDVPVSTPTEALLLPPEPQDVTFYAEDGEELHGRYYPAAVDLAPGVVLMNWVHGNQDEWTQIAYWLQNRGLGKVASQNPGYLEDPSWFPAVPEGGSYAVFTFNFRGCESKEGCTGWSDSWLLDAQAAMLRASEFKGIEYVMAAGASTGADGAVDGCFWLNQQKPNSCLGAFALSPGGYLGVPFYEAVEQVSEETPSKPVWCLASNNDPDAISTCRNARGNEYKVFRYPGDLHGMELFRPSLDPQPLALLLDELELIDALAREFAMTDP